jgi:RNA polymerase sigma-70 factor (ECF subfamily)
MNECSGYIQFVTKARSGDRSAMGRLATLVWDRLYPFAFRMTMDHNTAEDVLQETLLAMLCRLDTLRSEQHFWPWIYRIAWSKIQDRQRDRRLQSSFAAEQLRCSPAFSHSDPLDAQLCAETCEQVAAAVEQLGRRYRDILQLRCFEDLPYTKVAALTRTTPAQARTHFHRAKRSLKRRLACCV